jgi:hypothetical protein
LSKVLARALSALVTVIWVSDEVVWALIEGLGRKFSCYSGAMRLYWPALNGAGDGSVSGRVWTPDHLENMDWNGEGMAGCEASCASPPGISAAHGIGQ